MNKDQADSNAMRQCSERVFSGERWDIRGHMCGTGATVQVDGQWWCKRHSPEGKAAAKAKFEAKMRAYKVAQMEKAKREERKRRQLGAYPRLTSLLKESQQGISKDWIARRDALLAELGE